MNQMIKKQRLPKTVESDIETGELSIPLLNRHLTTALFLSKLGSRQARPVREKISFVLASPERREHLLAELKVNLQAS